MKIPFVGGSSESYSPAEDIQRCVNFKVEIDQQEKREALVPVEGLKLDRSLTPTQYLMMPGGVDFFSASDYDLTKVF